MVGTILCAASSIFSIFASDRPLIWHSTCRHTVPNIRMEAVVVAFALDSLPTMLPASYATRHMLNTITAHGRRAPCGCS